MEWCTPFSDRQWVSTWSALHWLRLWTACASLCTYIDTNSNQHVPCATTCAGYCWALTNWWWKNFIVSRGFHMVSLSLPIMQCDPRKSRHIMIFDDSWRSRVLSILHLSVVWENGRLSRPCWGDYGQTWKFHWPIHHRLLFQSGSPVDPAWSMDRIVGMYRDAQGLEFFSPQNL